MAQMSEMQCQVCHKTTFHSFSDGHPAFSAYPHDQRTHIYFDHLAHREKHFKDRRFRGQEKAWQCADCHVLDAAGQSIQVRSFEQTCAECHDGQIRNDYVAGIPFFSIPAIDSQTLRKHKLDIGHWPGVRRHPLADGLVSPLTQILMAEQEGFADAVQTLDGIDLSDLASASENELGRVKDFAWAFKKSLFELVKSGESQFRQQLQLTLDSEYGECAAGMLLFQKLVDVQRRWFPRLDQELRQSAANTDVADTSSTNETTSDDDDVSEDANPAPVSSSHLSGPDAGWYMQDLDLSLRYRPTGHADSWLRAWLDATAKSGAHGATRADSDGDDSPMQRVFADLSTPTSPGRCMKCHTASVGPDGSRHVHWQPGAPTAGQSTFTTFIHEPHLASRDGQTCTSCHQDNDAVLASPDRLFRSEFINADWSANTNPSHSVSDFAAMEKEACMRCHTRGRAEESCLTCHNYHVTALDHGSLPSRAELPSK